MLVKDYFQAETRIRIFDDYCSTKDNKQEIKDIIVGLFLKNVEMKKITQLK